MVRGTLFSHEGEGILLLPQAIEEYRQVVVEVQFLDLHLPGEPVDHSSVIDLNWQISSFVEPDGAIRHHVGGVVMRQNGDDVFYRIDTLSSVLHWVPCAPSQCFSSMHYFHDKMNLIRADIYRIVVL